MSCLKRPLDGQDPDYEDTIPNEAKRLRLLEKNAKVEFSQRISSIIQKEFSTELSNQEKDVHEIEHRLHQALKWLKMLRYVIISAFYNKKEVQNGPEEKQKRIHPAVKKLIGKEPRNWKPLQQRPSKYRPVVTTCEEEPTVSKEESSTKENEKKETVSKVPRYIPPKTSTNANSITLTSPLRGMHHKVKKRIVIGNISKWLPVDTREDSASHRWMVYVRGPREAPDVSDFVSKVRFFLHPSYRPHDIAEVMSPPFHLSRRGWGEFPVRVQIHFSHSRNKPVDVIHHLKLDRTYTGLQTLGAETVVDIWLHSGGDSSILGNGNEVVSTKEGVSGGNSDTLEQLAQAEKVNGSVNEVVSTKDNVYDGNSDTSEQLAQVVKVNCDINKVVSAKDMVSGGNSDPSEQMAQIVKVNDGGTSIISQEVCDSPAQEMFPGLIMPKTEPVDDSECNTPCVEYSECDASGHGGRSSSDMQFSYLDHDYMGVMKVDIKNESESFCKSEHSILDCSEENVSGKYTGLCKLTSSEMDSSVQNHVMEVAPLVQENKINSTWHTVEVPTKSVNVNSHLEQNASCTENNSKLTTLLKCVDKNGHIFYVTLGQTHPKPQVKLTSVVPTSEHCANVNNSTSLLNKQQASHTQIHNKQLSTTVVTSGLKLKSPLAKPVLSNYNCKQKDCVISQGNSLVLVPPHGTAGSVITTQSNVHNALPLETNCSSLVISQQTSTLTPLMDTNMKPGVQVPSSKVSTNISSELLKQLQNNSGKLLSSLKLNAVVPTTNKMEEGKKAGDLKASGQNASTPDQSFFILKNGQLYLLRHIQNATTLPALSAKSSAKKCESIPKQQSILLLDSRSLMSNSVRSVQGGFSLLKKQVNAGVPQNMSSPTTGKPHDMDKSENVRLLMSGRTLVLNKANSRLITHSDKLRYGEALSVAIESCKFDDVALSVRWLLRHMPLISPSARDIEFRMVHPYAAPNEATFLQWNIGKQRASEWLQAKAVQRVLQERFPKERVWSTHAIVVWAKLHGYTPVPHSARAVTEDIPSGPTTQITYSEPVGIMDWLVTDHKSDQCSGAESDGEVDVIGTEPLQKKARAQQGPSQFEEVGSCMEVLELDPDLEAQFLFVRETAREIGFRFPPQEIIPGMLFCATERVLLEAVRSLADDLLRRALCMAWKRNSNRYPGCIKIDDVRTAILTRPELDLFSNRGLGVQVADTG